MAEMTQQTPAQTPPQTPAPPQKPKHSKEQLQKRRKRIRGAVAGVVILALAGVGGFFLYRFLTAQESLSSTIQSQPAEISSIQSTVQGSGNAKAKESAAITLTQGGTVQEVFVTAGDTVTAGQVIGAVGTTAPAESAQGPHLHFSVSKDGDAVDPDTYLNG